MSDEQLYLEVVKTNPENHTAWFGLGMIYQQTNRYDKALEAFTKSYEITKDPHTAIWMANMNLGLGNWYQGFRQDYERWNWKDYKDQGAKVDAPRWTGEPLNGYSITLYGEAGEGDTIRGLRNIHCLQFLYPQAEIIYLSSPQFDELVRYSFPIKVIGPHELLPNTTFKSSILDIPMYLGHTWDNNYRPDRYLFAPRIKELYWRDRLATLPKKKNLGMCWFSKGGSKKIDFKLTGETNYISLQKPVKPPDHVLDQVVDWTDDLHSWADTAALISCLDNVFSIDTAVAHLAGALGIPVTCAVGYSNYWPWVHPDVIGDPEYSIWYPSMKLLRAKLLDDAGKEEILLANASGSC